MWSPRGIGSSWATCSRAWSTCTWFELLTVYAMVWNTILDKQFSLTWGITISCRGTREFWCTVASSSLSSGILDGLLPTRWRTRFYGCWYVVRSNTILEWYRIRKPDISPRFKNVVSAGAVGSAAGVVDRISIYSLPPFSTMLSYLKFWFSSSTASTLFRKRLIYNTAVSSTP